MMKLELYMSAALREVKLSILAVPFRISGAMYLLVPTCEKRGKNSTDSEKLFTSFKNQAVF